MLRITTSGASLAAFVAIIALTSVLLVTSSSPSGPWGSAEKVSFVGHPLLMSMSFACAMPLGLLAYVLEAPFWGSARRVVEDRHVRRKLHGTLNTLATIFCLIGWWVAFSVREAKGKGHLPWGKPWDKQVHVWAGLAAMALCTLQACGGLFKYLRRTKLNERVLIRHGKFGYFMWTAGCASLATGVYFSFITKGYVTTGVIILSLLFLVILSVWLLLYALPRPCLFDSNADRFVGCLKEPGPINTSCAAVVFSASETGGVPPLSTSMEPVTLEGNTITSDLESATLLQRGN